MGVWVCSVCSAVGVMPLSLQYGFGLMERFLAGARSVDTHFLTAEFSKVLCPLSRWVTAA